MKNVLLSTDGIIIPLHMNELINNLSKLQSIEFDEHVGPDMEKRIAELRAKIPAPILGHYDRLVARGKKGLAAVQKQVCTACHMHVPRGVVLTLMHGEDVQLCENCGRYLYLSEQPEFPALAAPEKKSKAPRGRNTLLHAA
jgi:predicted  nucleic acid-binding Zn-ribbon protein